MTDSWLKRIKKEVAVAGGTWLLSPHTHTHWTRVLWGMWELYTQHLGAGSWGWPSSPGYMDIPSSQTESSNRCQSGQGQPYSADQSLCGSVVAVQKGLHEEKLHPVYVEQLYSEWAWGIIYSLNWHHLEWSFGRSSLSERWISKEDCFSWGGAASSTGPPHSVQ